jgi:enediyne biosynthesis protein E4
MKQRRRALVHRRPVAYIRNCFFFDYDLDGLPDIVAVNGHVADDIGVLFSRLSITLNRLCCFAIWAAANSKMSPAKLALRFASLWLPAAQPTPTFDNDGDLDLVITTNNGPARLLRNDNGNRNDMLRVKLVGTKSNRDAIGARVISRRASLPLTFGLGRPGGVSEVNLEIAWPSGRKESLSHVKPDQSLVIEEGKGIVSAHPIAFTPKSEP